MIFCFAHGVAVATGRMNAKLAKMSDVFLIIIVFNNLAFTGFDGPNRYEFHVILLFNSSRIEISPCHRFCICIINSAAHR